MSKIINLCVVKLSNSRAIACVPRLDLDYFESQSDSLRLNQRLPGAHDTEGVRNNRVAEFWIKLELQRHNVAIAAFEFLSKTSFVEYYSRGSIGIRRVCCRSGVRERRKTNGLSLESAACVNPSRGKRWLWMPPSKIVIYLPKINKAQGGRADNAGSQSGREQTCR